MAFNYPGSGLASYLTLQIYDVLHVSISVFSSNPPAGSFQHGVACCPENR